jgi:hypothetical protein
MEAKKRKYYVLLKCNEWKEYSSMRIVGVFTWKGLIKVIKKRVKAGDFEFDNIKKIDQMIVNEIDNFLKYGHIIEVEINEEVG